MDDLSSAFGPSKAQLRHDPIYYVKLVEKLKNCIAIFEHQEIPQCFRGVEDEPGADESTIKNAVTRKKALLMDGITVDASLHDLVCVFTAAGQSIDALIPTEPVEGGYVRIGYNFSTKTESGRKVYEELLRLVVTYLGEKHLTDSDLPVILGEELRVAQTVPRSWRLDRGYVYDKSPLGVSKEIFSPVWKKAVEREKAR
ncbi:hypothetical protein BDV26DRAFT_301317 [Aspergillus bertholletiae]|uniref:Uncharacterized protein n=1 Tax=Aspergillus bertholletiae TaxID=1226010 RepID=A0A5N7AUW0_9EURO|nr:hypothetical protein BDV26DRAFT_301317 [Aspergillus bertholletiae]